MAAVGLVVCLGGFAGGYLVATNVLFPGVEAAAGDLEVPDFRGMEWTEAAELVEREGLEMGVVDSIRHPERSQGRVLGQSPLPGQRTFRGTTVDLTLSAGPERRPVPDVSRLRPGRAVEVLEGTGFQVEVDSVEAPVASGWVAGVFPEPGTEVTLPGEVTLEVSLGPPTVEMPLLTGLSREQATGLLEARGLEVSEVEHRFRFGYGVGTVLDQDPAAGQDVERGAGVRLVVGRPGVEDS